MRNLAAFCALVGCLTIVSTGCGESDCEKVADKRAQWALEYCETKKNDCCYCRCDLEGKTFDRTVSDQCTCKVRTVCEDDRSTPEDECAPPACEGFEKESARRCLEDEAYCKRASVIELIDIICK